MENEQAKVIEELQKKVNEQEETIQQLYITLQGQISALGAVLTGRGLISADELEKLSEKTIAITKEKVGRELMKE